MDMENKKIYIILEKLEFEDLNRNTIIINLEVTMDDQSPWEENVTDEFKKLGKNLFTFIKTAWESQESQNIQNEIQDGVNELGNSLRVEFDNFTNSPSGQKIKTDLQEFQEKVSSGEIEAKFRSDLANSLNAINQELQKLTEQLQNKDTDRNAASQCDSINNDTSE